MKANRRTCNEVNWTIHRENLYIVIAPCDNRRVVDCHLFRGEPTVRDLWTGKLYSVKGNSFVNGYGKTMVF